MPVFLTCPCGRNLQVKEEFAGQDGRCPRCGQTLLIPPTEAGAPADVPADANVAAERITTGLEANSARSRPAVPLPAGDERTEPLPTTPGVLSADADFFVDPPAEIGPVTSAATTLRQGERPWSLVARGGLGIVLALAGVLVGGIIVKACDIRDDFWWWACTAGGLGLGAALAWFLSDFTHTCTYVGQDGVAHYECTGDRDFLTIADVFLFRDATELRTDQTRNYTNGIYQSTTYTFTWTDVGGRARYQISNSHDSKEGNPPPADLFHYARAAEVAWTIDLLRQAQRQVELAGSVRFNLKGGRWIRLARERIVFRMEEKPQEWAASDLARVYVENGAFAFVRKVDHKGVLPPNSVYRFPFANLANARLFLLLLDSLIGVEPEYLE